MTTETQVQVLEGLVLALEKMDALIGQVIAAQAELRDEVHALANRIESVSRVLSDRTDHLA